MINVLFSLRDRCKRCNYSLSPFFVISFLFIFIPLLVIIYFSIHPSVPKAQVVSTMDMGVLVLLLRSIYVALVAVIIGFALGYPFAYFLAGVQSATAKKILITFVSSPLWSSFFVKLLGLKSFLDLLNGEINSTHGIIYVVIGLVYVNLPLIIINLFNILNNLPRNLVNASLDLGSTRMDTLRRVIMPYTRESIWSCVFLVFLPSLSSVAISEFLNHSANHSSIGVYMSNLIGSDGSSTIARSRISFLTLSLATGAFLFWLLFRFLSRKISDLRGRGWDA